MNRTLLLIAITLSTVVSPVTYQRNGCEPAQSTPETLDVTFKKTVVDTRYISEGVAIGDVNRDGKQDILAGNVWYQAPKWTAHEIAPVADVDRKTWYSNCFQVWTDDLNHDGWVDEIVIGMPGEKAVWRENPGKADGAWKEHRVWHSAGNESPLYVDLFRTGKKVLIMGYDDANLAWFEPDKDPNKEWVCHDVSELKGSGSQRYSHGLGVGDLDSDGHNEILTIGGFYRESKGSWTFTPTELGPDCAHMLVSDVNNDKKSDVLTTSAHGRGVWWFEQLEAGKFERHLIDETVSETHSANLMTLGKAHKVNLITGKRKWAHPPGVDVGSEEPSLLIRYELSHRRWTRYVIDEDSGVGTQFVIQDVNGDKLEDIVTSNKNGVFLFTQVRQ